MIWSLIFLTESNFLIENITPIAPEPKCSDKEAFLINAGKLAFVGDAVFELMVRNTICRKYNLNICETNKLKVSAVCCEAQAKFFKKIEPYLSEKEMAIYKRGRNSHTGNVPKKSSPQTYHIATGLETLFGYLYFSGNIKRLKELMTFLDL